MWWMVTVVNENIFNLTENSIGSVFEMLEKNNYFCMNFSIVQDVPIKTYDYILSFFMPEKDNDEKKIKESMIIKYKKGFKDNEEFDIVINKLTIDNENKYSMQLIQKKNMNILDYMIQKILEYNLYIIINYIDGKMLNFIMDSNQFSINKNFPIKILEYQHKDLFLDDNIEKFICGKNMIDYDFDQIL